MCQVFSNDFKCISFPRVMEFSAVNKMQSTNLAIVFGPTIMRSEGDSLAIAALMPIQSRVMEAFLTDYDTIFGKS